MKGRFENLFAAQNTTVAALSLAHTLIATC